MPSEILPELDFNIPAATEIKRKYRFHLLGLVHLPVSERYMGCAFTQKIVKMSKMLMSLGHDVFLYGAEGSDAPSTEFIQTHTLKQIRQEWGDGDNRFEIGYDWKTWGFRHDFNAERTDTTKLFWSRAYEAILESKRDSDYLLVMQGQYHKPVADVAKLFLTVEPGIGYRGSYAAFRAFESAYLMNFTYGSGEPYKSVDGAYYWRVIPNYFDEKDFPYQEKKEDYFFYIGRVIRRKGVMTAARATHAIGAKLLIAGQQSNEINIKKDLPPNCEFIGYVEPDERAALLGAAKAVFVPTLYLEAFGGVNVEAQLCGTPAITTDFGVFPETVVHGVTGFRCSTLDDFVQASKDVERLNPLEIRKHAERYLTKNVRWEFQKYWDDLYQVYRSVDKPKGTTFGWNYINHDRLNGSR